jgi:Ig-like domain from next to BRCA1 gene
MGEETYFTGVYPSRSQIAPFYSLRSAICDRGHYSILATCVCIKTSEVSQPPAAEDASKWGLCFCYNDFIHCPATTQDRKEKMRQKFTVLISIAAALALFMSACGAGAQPTPDAAAISTAAAQTVEARFTQLAEAITATPLPATDTPVPQVTDTPTTPATQTPDASQPTATSNGKPCYVMTFISDLTIPDGMIIAPGATFTKSWRVRNDGNCVWDQSYSLVFDKGTALSSVTSFPLPRKVYPGDTLDLSVPMTASTSDGSYSSYWHIATPYGGFFGVGSYNQDLLAQIQVTSKPDRDFGIASVVYDWSRTPQKGCGNDGAVYNFTATITANAPGEINYQWQTNPSEAASYPHSLSFDAAGPKTVYFTWSMTNGHIQGIDRSVWLTTTIGTQSTDWTPRVLFNFTCK